MKKGKNDFTNQKGKKRTGELNYSIKLPIKENWISKQIKKVKNALITILIIFAIILFIVAMYNDNNQYVLFNKDISIVLQILALVIVFLSPTIDLLLNRIVD